MDSDKFICKKCAKEISHEDVKNNEVNAINILKIGKIYCLCSLDIK